MDAERFRISRQLDAIDLQRMRARQVWDEMKHGQLNADVLLRGGWINREDELMEDVRANAQDNLAYFGRDFAVGVGPNFDVAERAFEGRASEFRLGHKFVDRCREL